MADLRSTAAEAFRERSWGEAHRRLTAMPRAELAPEDLEHLAVSAYLIGRDDDAVAGWTDAHTRYMERDERAEAARCAFWVALCSMLHGQMAHAGGWLSRAEAVLGDDLDCAARGYLLVPAFLGALDADDVERARALAGEVGDIAARFGDADLAAFGTLGEGQALLAMGDAPAGLGRLDDVMLSVCSDHVGPIVSGIVYCAVILECMQVFDLARASEWTASLQDWCASQPDLVPYRGQCLVHQSQLEQAAGEWSRAASTAALACARLADPPHPALGLAHYQDGELQRLRGDWHAAEHCYARANKLGHEPMPGLALLELARGDEASAAASIRRALGETSQLLRRPALLAAAVEIFIANGSVGDAAEAREELTAIADRAGSDVLRAMSEQATGAVLLASGAPMDALAHLRTAGARWRRLRMPYEAARTAVLLAQGCLALGDRSSARLELEAARETFEQLGAAPELAHLGTLTDRRERVTTLSVRELDVLARVAAGKTNREVADELSISPHTVGRHLENIYAKLGVSSRAAATAYAYQHDLL